MLLLTVSSSVVMPESFTASGGTLLIATASVYVLTPPSLSWILAPTERVPLSVVEQVVLLVEPKLP